MRWLASGRGARVTLAILLFPFGFRSVQAVLFYSTASPTFNTTAPTGALAGSGWQWQGRWAGFLGTPIAPHYFITAKHVGGGAGDHFSLEGTDYTTTAVFDDADSDLRLCRVRETFPSFAPLYTGSEEVGKRGVVFGRGTQRGAEFSITDRLGTHLRGWYWGITDGVQRWGQSSVEELFDGGPGSGLLLRLPFRSDGGTNQAHLSGGDSGGGFFFKDGATWKLAGVNNSVDGPFNTTTKGDGFYAALFDASGLYELDKNTNWVIIPTVGSPVPSAFYATRISDHLAWIQSVLASPIPPSLLSAMQVTGPYTDEFGATVNAGTQAFTVSRAATQRFYRLQDVIPRQILSLQVADTNVVILYQ